MPVRRIPALTALVLSFALVLFWGASPQAQKKPRPPKDESGLAPRVEALEAAVGGMVQPFRVVDTDGRFVGLYMPYREFVVVHLSGAWGEGWFQTSAITPLGYLFTVTGGGYYLDAGCLERVAVRNLSIFTQWVYIEPENSEHVMYLPTGEAIVPQPTQYYRKIGLECSANPVYAYQEVVYPVRVVLDFNVSEGFRLIK